ncbi:MAG TPA: two-component regulator propeller domain-containing protein [Anaerolineae bacterium]|nr:two-component regulator propeller domain-containing protein [Anaerolineae bacterium]
MEYRKRSRFVPWRAAVSIVGLPLLLALTVFLSTCASTPTPLPQATPAAVDRPEPARPPTAAARPRHDNDVRFTNLSLDQGLSQSVVQAIWQDSQGFLWLGTQDGLNRYDGYTFRIFKNDPGDPASLSNNYVYSLAEDADGSLWVGTAGGLNRYDPATERFEALFHDPLDPNTPSSDAVGDVLVDSAGALWAGTVSQGINRLEGGVWTRYLPNPDDPSGLSSGAITALFEDSSGTLWVGTTGGGLNRLDRATGRFTRYLNDQQDPLSLPDNSVASIAEGPDGTLWLATSGGLAAFDPTTGRCTRYASDPSDPGSLGDNLLLVVYVDRSGTLWAGSSAGSLNRLPCPGCDPPAFVHYAPVAGDPTSLGSLGVISIYEDRGGVLWFGTFGGGVSRYSWTTEKFPVTRSVPGDPAGLSDNSVWSFYEDRQGDLWIGTVSGGLNRLDRATGAFTHYRYDPSDPESLGSDFVMSVYEDAQGRFWVGTFGGGLNLLDRQTGKVARYPSPPNVFSFLEDSSGSLWVAATGGLGRYDSASDSFEYLANDPSDPASLSDSNLTSLHLDSRGRIWVGTFAGGLNLFDPATQSFVRYRHNPADPASLASDLVLVVLEDSKGMLWVGTAAGLDRMDPVTGSFLHYRQKEGLPNDTVYCLLEDDRGHLWISTNRGLSDLDTQSGTFTNYTSADGLQSNEFNQAACYRDSTGLLYFGGINGYNAFLPADIVQNRYVPPVVVTGFSLFNNPVLPGAGTPLAWAVPATREIRLNHRQNFFGFEFAALDMAAPERNRYSYRMEGLDEGWNDVGTRHFAQYTGVKPGTYTFWVRGSNGDGVWNEAGTSIRLVIPPPFWQTWWFRGLAIALAAGLVAGGFLLRLRMIQAEKRRLETLVAARTQELSDAMGELRRSRDQAQAANRAKSVFLANISHELRTPLNAILGFSRLMLGSSLPARDHAPSPERGTLTESQRQDLAIISRSGEHLLGLINDVLEMSKIEAGRITLNEHAFDLRRLLEDMEDMFRLRAEAKGLALESEVDPGVPQVVGADEGKLRQVLLNLLGNAVKFTQTGDIFLRAAIRTAGEGSGEPVSLLHVEVEDTGPGIAPEEQAAVFEPFVQSQSGRRAAEGTGLGLSISRQYAELMGGTLSLSSTPGRGSLFTLEVPVRAVDEAALPGAPSQRRAIGLEPGQPAYRLLVVDDKEVNRQLLVRLLGPLGFDLREAANGQEAIDIWQAWAPHLIWMDMRMPVMDGYEATRRIKATLQGHATAIIALTASALEEDRKVILSEGCDDYIRKPFRDQDLIEALERHLGVRFLYEQVAEEERRAVDREPRPSEQELSAADAVRRVAALPPSVVGDLRHAARLGAVDSIQESISGIRSHDAALAGLLAAWADRFEHDKILALIEDAAARRQGLGL